MFTQNISAQTQDTIADRAEQDREKLEELTSKSKFTRWLQKAVFKPGKKQTQQTNIQAINPNEIDKNLEKYHGKIIRNINIVTLDPFGYSEKDSTRVPHKTLDKIGNNLHLKTKAFTIRNLLLFDKNKPFDSIQIKESERIIRSQRYIRRVLITPQEIANNPDSVDIHIRVLDSWSIYPSGSISTSGMRVKLTSYNFGGFGHYFSNEYRNRFNENREGYSSQYQLNNIANTFITTGISYREDLNKNISKSLYAERPFYSPLTKWAGGFSLSQHHLKDSVYSLENEALYHEFKYNYIDVWGGYAIKLSEKETESKVITNLIASVRFTGRDHMQKPPLAHNPDNFYSDSQRVLFSLGINSMNYIQDRYIYHHDRIEDIAVGKIFSLTTGVQQLDYKNRTYFGARFALGKYTNSGYFGGEVQWGSYFHKSHLEQSVFRMEGIYFTRAFKVGRWLFRQFFNPELVYGYNRLDNYDDKITLNGSYGIDGFDSYNLRGTKKLLLNFQTQSYAPNSWFGFRFSPFLSGSLGLISDKGENFFKNELYTSVTLGIMITNDFLNVSRIQLSLSYYPKMPGVGNHIIKTNHIRNSNFRLQDFRYGAPQPVPYL